MRSEDIIQILINHDWRKNTAIPNAVRAMRNNGIKRSANVQRVSQMPAKCK